MVIYFIKKYVQIWLVFLIGLTGLTIFLARMPPGDAIPRAIFWGGVFAAVQLFMEFRKKKVWPLYDNLRISKKVLFGCVILVNTLFALGLSMWSM